MSITASRTVWKLQLPPAQKVIMLCLAEHHNKDTDQCNPSHDTIAEMTGLSRRQVIRVLDELESGGVIQIQHHRGRNKSNDYVICAIKCDTTSHLQRENVTSEPENVTQNVTFEPIKCDIAMSHEPFKPFKPNKESTIRPGEVGTKVLEICQLDYDYVETDERLRKSMLKTFAYLGERDVTAEQVVDFENWRKAHHWTRAGPPTIKQVGEYWLQYEEWVKAGRPAAQQVVKQNGVHKNGQSRPGEQQRIPNGATATATGGITPARAAKIASLSS